MPATRKGRNKNKQHIYITNPLSKKDYDKDLGDDSKDSPGAQNTR